MDPQTTFSVFQRLFFILKKGYTPETSVLIFLLSVYFDNVYMTKFIVYNRTDAWKTDMHLNSFVCPLIDNRN